MWRIVYCEGRLRIVFWRAWKVFRKFCPLCYKQVIALSPRRIKDKFSLVFSKFSQIALVATWLGQFCENFENACENFSLILLGLMRLHIQIGFQKKINRRISRLRVNFKESYWYCLHDIRISMPVPGHKLDIWVRYSQAFAFLNLKRQKLNKSFFPNTHLL